MTFGFRVTIAMDLMILTSGLIGLVVGVLGSSPVQFYTAVYSRHKKIQKTVAVGNFNGSGGTRVERQKRLAKVIKNRSFNKDEVYEELCEFAGFHFGKKAVVEKSSPAGGEAEAGTKTQRESVGHMTFGFSLTIAMDLMILTSGLIGLVVGVLGSSHVQCLSL